MVTTGSGRGNGLPQWDMVDRGNLVSTAMGSEKRGEGGGGMSSNVNDFLYFVKSKQKIS